MFYIWIQSKMMKKLTLAILSCIGAISINAQTPSKEDIKKALGEFIDCPAGTFVMGSPQMEKGRSNDEKQHEVELSSFSLQAMEVTQRSWEMVMGSNPSDDRTWKDNPVTNVSYTMAQLYIQRLNELTGELYSLPTEAQWEYAARCGQKGNKVYAGADSILQVAWFIENSDGRVHVVGELQPNAWGFYDMSGNVMEWCSDQYADYRLDQKNKKDPKGADRSSLFVLRGGAWKSPRNECRVAARSENGKGVDKSTYGLRLVRMTKN
jgi:formylglycine-generating enzyme required for sulfatase activity